MSKTEDKKVSRAREYKVTIRVSEKELDIFRKGAEKAHRTVADYVRTLVLKDVYN